MNMATRRARSQPTESGPGVSGVVRLDRRTKTLTRRLRPGDIAVIDHLDLDRVSAESLAHCGVAAVVNVAASISGRYPNLGPQLLVQAGIPVLDRVGPKPFAVLREGQQIRLDGNRLYADDVEVAGGELLTSESVEAAMTEARAGLALQLEAFVSNTMEYVKRERDLLLDGVGVPPIATDLTGRHVLVVVRGYHYREDLAALRPYIREYRPLFLGVDGGADALLEAGYRPDLVVGDMDSVSDDALRCGGEIVVHAYPDGTAPGFARVEALGLSAVLFPAAATSEDVAMLLADAKGASLIVAVGTHNELIEFLDKGRSGMASTFLTRLRLGGKLVDAKGVSRLYRSRISTSSLLWLVIATLVLFLTALAISSAGHAYLELVADYWHSFLFWLSELFN